MLSFFRKKEPAKMEGDEAVVTSSELLDEPDADEYSEEEIETELSIHTDWAITREDQYTFQFLNTECPPLRPNQISLYGIRCEEIDIGEYEITAFIRSSLNKTIRLRETTLVLLDSSDKLLGRKTVYLSAAGDIPGKSSRPWRFTFQPADLYTAEVPRENWKLAFHLKSSARRHALDLQESWEESLAKKDKRSLEKMVDEFSPPKEGEVNFMGLKAMQKDNGQLQVTMLIRNGSEKDVSLERIPLAVEDATMTVVAEGSFTVEDFIVKANTSKPWTFIFPSELVTEDEIDLNTWRAYPIQLENLR
ncbi:accessory Sec system S-layer assembly protein [Alteribacillus sp. HJP-4]|uniref:accessory Sec system S-layer assembly protein n=1 Tax=Alteribacillus sp. HJP-4 TaxID=2775394 RepID=UPI0035CD322B